MFKNPTRTVSVPGGLGRVDTYANEVHVAHINAPASRLYSHMEADAKENPRNKRPSAQAIACGAAIAINGTWAKFWNDKKPPSPAVLITTSPDGTKTAHFPRETTGRKGREALLIYPDGRMLMPPDNQIVGGSWASTQSNVAKLLDDHIQYAGSFGPALIRDGAKLAIAAKFQADGRRPRTAIGQINDIHWVVIVADKPGMTMTALRDAMFDLGCVQAYNLDGGGSCALWVRGAGLINKAPDGFERATSDILYWR